MAAEYYFDSGVFVTPILKNRETSVIRECLEWQRRMATHDIVAYTSYLTWDEVAYVAGRATGAYSRSFAAKAGELFLALTDLRFVSVDDRTIRRAQAILRDHGLRPRDSIHASSSLIHAGGNFVSLDADFKIKAPLIGLTLHEIS
jgi:predicted nucleic acid-binding protein